MTPRLHAEVFRSKTRARQEGRRKLPRVLVVDEQANQARIMAIGLRVDFALDANDIVRVYEIAAWGR